MNNKLTLETAIAYRSFELESNPNEIVEVFIGKPEKLQEDEWICRYRIVGAGKDMNFQIHSIDSIQVLQLVFNVIDSAIIGADLALLWDGEKFSGFTSSST